MLMPFLAGVLWAGAVLGANEPPQITTGEMSFTKTVIGTGVDQAHAAVGADFDGDGDIDVVATDYIDGDLYWYENDGSLNYTPHVLESALDGAYPASVADLDLDGDMDVLACGYLADAVVWYENDGTGLFTRHDVDLAADGAHSVVAGDMDGDGDSDLLTTNQDSGTVDWYENDGSMGFTHHLIDGTVLMAKRAEFADINNDSIPDVVACGYGWDEVMWYENDGSENFTRHHVSNTPDGAYFVSPADLDGDGDLDIVTASRLDNTVAWHENDGAGVFTSYDIDTEALGARMVQTVDMDRDGDVDIVASSVDDHTVGWYENDGTGSFTARVIDVYSLGAYGLGPIDVDFDGDMDVFTASRDANDVALHRQVRLHRAELDNAGDTLLINAAVLTTTDAENPAGSLTYTLTTAPIAGEVRLAGAPLLVGGTFSQADINAGQLEYVHDGSPLVADGFEFMVADSGLDGVEPATGLFEIYIGSTILSHWPLDESAGTIAGDVVGSNDGNLLAGPVWEPALGKVGGAIDFDGVNDRIDIGGVDIANGNGLTLALWVQPQALSSDKRIFSKANGTGEQDHYWMISTYNGNQLRFRLKTDGVTSTLVATPPVLSVGQWCHIAVTYDGKGMRIYSDGVLIGSLPKSGTVTVDPAVMVAIGNQPVGAGEKSFAGLIDEVRIYRRALLPQEVLALANPDDLSAVGPGATVVGPASIARLSNAPNPFNPLTKISYDSNRAGYTNLEVFDIRGNLVRTLIAGHRAAGLHDVFWDGRDDQGKGMASGVYLYRLEIDEVSQARRMLLVR